jgi:DNA polymerase-3 subunit epsilon
MVQALAMQLGEDTYLLTLGREDLKRALDAFGIVGVDRRSSESMRRALARSSASKGEVSRALSAGCPTKRHERDMTSFPTAREATPCRSTRATRTQRAANLADLSGPFVAIDFETADSGRDSACAVGVVRVEGDEVVRRLVRLVRPPRRNFVFTYIHGIRWTDVQHEPMFDTVWRELTSVLDGARYLVAHNASFDKSVLHACCRSHGIVPSSLPFECTVKWARRAWGIYPTNLPAVCQHLRLSLNHHDAGSDAEACARIMIAARGTRPSAGYGLPRGPSPAGLAPRVW